jgi:hypothetical protein
MLAGPHILSRLKSRWLDLLLLLLLQVHEFSHTIIHGRPQPGQLVVALHPGSSSSSSADAGSPDKPIDAAAAAAAGGGRIRLSAPPAVGLPVRLSAVPPKPAVPRLSGPGEDSYVMPPEAWYRHADRVLPCFQKGLGQR